ncbi:MAG: Lrp/AsnC family transcriptional regulator [Acidimicrobiia bacterium]|nr:Lrp/AsnC family transcriptional regulator [Acidimicrobiia bacterium]NNC42270.1 Lrp/AsnC family transcriptional regulator [Acidimicrobiia bacterium]NND13700.1 Lrp/AsnC family transcriptional regulator [Acidimicrobiia bacterium]NNL27219.1 Lrp/AsnC family transcriptional regulator [Acidimicrobiia bacterium]NNL48260.1 Lrp/AsnC family transcriptional regulator [Acidimicrobiia bacterium]
MELDDISWILLEALQENARLSYKDLGERVGLTAPAVADRVRRLEKLGIIRGYRADLDLALLGWPIVALVRLSPRPGLEEERVEEVVLALDNNVLEAHRVTGSEHMWVKLGARSLQDLDRILGKIRTVASTTTSVRLSTLVENKNIHR